MDSIVVVIKCINHLLRKLQCWLWRRWRCKEKLRLNSWQTNTSLASSSKGQCLRRIVLCTMKARKRWKFTLSVVGYVQVSVCERMAVGEGCGDTVNIVEFLAASEDRQWFVAFSLRGWLVSFFVLTLRFVSYDSFFIYVRLF